MLVVMAGLPGTGKSTLARRIAELRHGVVLDKDSIRAVLFPPPTLDYSVEQDDIAVAASYRAAVRILTTSPRQFVILDGRTYRQARQVRDLLAAVEPLALRPRFLHCVAEDTTIRERLDADFTAGWHPARNRTFAFYQSVKATCEALPVPHLTLDTGRTPLEECVAQALTYLGES